MDFNALCDAEEDFPGIMQGEVDVRSFRSIRTLVRHALAAHHPDLTDREVGEIIHDAGISDAANAVTEAMAASFPTAEAGEPTANPRKVPAKAGTGKPR
ncbi:MAG: hypothetical protein ACK4JY_03750 [Brevundimonas sp.]|uniref:hypothetical protein n=1 Tax=Brevundimonas sp. TaxID=1871086 RepID=UPI00391894C8